MSHGILLVNLGTPDSPRTGDVRRYLDEFLMDGRVIDIHPLARALLVKGIIVPFRGPKAAETYRQIWTDRGSPLLLHSVRLKELLQERLGGDSVVELAMRYQHPDIPEVLEKMRRLQLSWLTVVPLFPQYASATVGSVHQKVMDSLKSWETIPEIRFVSQFYDHPKVIQAFAERGAPMIRAGSTVFVTATSLMSPVSLNARDAAASIRSRTSLTFSAMAKMLPPIRVH